MTEDYGEWVNSASYKKCNELFLEDTTRLKSFPTLPMYRDTAGNAVTYEAVQPEGASKSGQKRVYFPNDKSDRAGKFRQLDGYTVNYHPCTYCGKNHSPSVCQLINHPEGGVD